MSGGTVIRRDSVCDNISEFIRLGAKFDVNTENSIFRIGETDNVPNKNYYDEMLNMLNDIEDCELGFLLRIIWRRYKDALKVVEDNASEKNICFDEEKEGVYINLRHDTKDSWDPNEESNIGWDIAYSTIFHELFHNIDYAACPEKGTYFTNIYKNKDFKHSSGKYKYIEKAYQFGEIVIADVKELIGEENNKNISDEKKRLNKLTFSTPKKNKAALYDIIGAELYKGKYGCYPDNSKFYYKNNVEFYDKKGEECKNKNLCKADSLANPHLRYCESRKECNRDNCEYARPGANSYYVCNRSREHINCTGKCHHRIYTCKYRCSNKNACVAKITCDLKNNNWCNEIYGHGNEKGENYWLKKGKDDYPKILAEEAFAHMAAAAISNFDAYENIKECLPNSERMFRELLRKMVGCELNILCNT